MGILLVILLCGYNPSLRKSQKKKKKIDYFVRTLGEMGARASRPVAAGCAGGRVSGTSRSAAKPMPKCHNSAACRRFRPKQRAKRPQPPVYPPFARYWHPPGRRRRSTDRSTCSRPTCSRPLDLHLTARPASNRPTCRRPTDRAASWPTCGRPTNRAAS